MLQKFWFDFITDFMLIFPSFVISVFMERRKEYFRRFMITLGGAIAIVLVMAANGLSYREVWYVMLILHLYSFLVFEICNNLPFRSILYCKIWSTALYYFELQLPICFSIIFPGISKDIFFICVHIIGMFIITGIGFIIFRKVSSRSIEQVSWSEIVLALVITIFAVITGRLFYINYSESDTKSIMYLYQLVSMLFVLLTLYLQLYIHINLKEKREMQYRENIWEMEKKYFRIRKEEIDLVNHKCHDLKHQIAALKFEKDEKRFNEIIADLQKAVMIYDTSIKTDNVALKMLLIDKQNKFKEDKIVFRCVVDGIPEEIMDVSDLYILLGNALDNAYDSVINLDESRRKIDLLMVRDGNFIRIKIQNPYDGEINMENNIPVSTKGKNHGYGFHSMKKILSKYRGNFVVETDNNIFSIKILIPYAKPIVQ